MISKNIKTSPSSKSKGIRQPVRPAAFSRGLPQGNPSMGFGSAPKGSRSKIPACQMHSSKWKRSFDPLSFAAPYNGYFRKVLYQNQRVYSILFVVFVHKKFPMLLPFCLRLNGNGRFCRLTFDTLRPTCQAFHFMVLYKQQEAKQDAEQEEVYPWHWTTTFV